MLFSVLVFAQSSNPQLPWFLTDILVLGPLAAAELYDSTVRRDILTPFELRLRILIIIGLCICLGVCVDILIGTVLRACILVVCIHICVCVGIGVGVGVGICIWCGQDPSTCHDG